MAADILMAVSHVMLRDSDAALEAGDVDQAEYLARESDRVHDDALKLGGDWRRAGEWIQGRNDAF